MSSILTTSEARILGKDVATCVERGRNEDALRLLLPVLAQRTPFRLLGLIGSAVGEGPLLEVNAFLKHLAARKLEGGWVVIGCALGGQLSRDLEGALLRCGEYVQAADVWYGADILGERVPGPALLEWFEAALNLLTPWRQHANRWVRRSVGVAVHFWAKRAAGERQRADQAAGLLVFLEPLFGEWQIDAVKGIGWGLKTLGKTYPDLVAPWLEQQLRRGKRHRALMLRKASTFLSEEQRRRLEEFSPHAA